MQKEILRSRRVIYLDENGRRYTSPLTQTLMLTFGHFNVRDLKVILKSKSRVSYMIINRKAVHDLQKKNKTLRKNMSKYPYLVIN